MTAKTKVIKKPQRSLAELSYLLEVVKGLGVTLKHFFKGTGHVQQHRVNRPDAVDGLDQQRPQCALQDQHQLEIATPEDQSSMSADTPSC